MNILVKTHFNLNFGFNKNLSVIFGYTYFALYDFLGLVFFHPLNNTKEIGYDMC